MNSDLFQRDPRDYALTMVEDGLVSANAMLLAALNYMSHDDVREMLDANELSPRFDEDENTTTCADCGEDFPDDQMLPLEEGGEVCTDCAHNHPELYR